MIILTDEQLAEFSNNYLGRLAEQTVLLDMMLEGFEAAFTPIENAPYDLVLDTDKGLLKVQVKATASVQMKKKTDRPSPQAVYSFKLKANEKPVVDVYAFVALHTGEILYVASSDLPAMTSSACTKRFGLTSFTNQSKGSFKRVVDALGVAHSRTD